MTQRRSRVCSPTVHMGGHYIYVITFCSWWRPLWWNVLQLTPLSLLREVLGILQKQVLLLQQEPLAHHVIAYLRRCCVLGHVQLNSQGSFMTLSKLGALLACFLCHSWVVNDLTCLCDGLVASQCRGIQPQGKMKHARHEGRWKNMI